MTHDRLGISGPEQPIEGREPAEQRLVTQVRATHGHC
jgi:hypothetical protein